jgi:D-threo-aldose 1-dehydrogenase
MSTTGRIQLTPDVATTRLGFGCAGLMRDPSRKRRQRLLAEAFDQGIDHFDVARMYGLGVAEKELGDFARHRRERIVIATKFGIEPTARLGRLSRVQGPGRRLLARSPALRRYARRRSPALHETHRYDVASARVSLHRSLQELQTDYIDILFVHDPSPGERLDLAEIGDFLEAAREAGQIRAWGVAGEQDPCLQIGRALPAGTVLQVRADALSPISSELAPPSPITFGAIGAVLGRIEAHLAGSPARRASWSDELGVDCSSPEPLAALLLGSALRVNPNGVVLFSTGRRERLGALTSLLSEPDEDVLDAFARRIADELACLPA